MGIYDDHKAFVKRLDEHEKKRKADKLGRGKEIAEWVQKDSKPTAGINSERYRENYDRIDWSKGKDVEDGSTVSDECGEVS